MITIEALERERQARLKEAVADVPKSDGKDEKREKLAAQIKGFTDLVELPSCTSYEAAERMIIKAMKAGSKFIDLRLDLTHQKLQVVPADVLRLGDSLCQLSVVGNMICELPADLDLCRRLRVLNLAANDLCGLPNLSELPDLSHVGLAYNRVDDLSLPLLVRCLPPGLQSLDLCANELCDIETLISTFDATLHSLRHLHLKANPICICRDYRNRISDSPLDAAEVDVPASAPASADASKRVSLRVSITQLKGLPDPTIEPTGAPASAPAAAPADDATPEEQQLVLAFSVLGERRTTRPVPRANIIDFEETSVVIEVPRSVELRDQLMVHGITFDVLKIVPPPPADEAAAEPDAQGEAAELPAETETESLGSVNSHWEALVSGQSSLGQVCQAVVQPPAPASKSKRGDKKASRRAKPPPPFTLALTVKVEIL